MMKTLASTVGLAGLLIGTALAHETGIPHKHPHSSDVTGTAVGKTGPNGGIVTVSGHHPIEMVASDAQLVFFVLDEDGKPADTAGSSGRAIVTQGGKNTTVTLAPSAPNKLAGALTAPLAPGGKVVLSTKLHGHAMQARFERK